MIAIGTIAFAHRMPAPDLRVSATPAGTATPTGEQPAADAARTATPQAFSASGAWTMSSLPGCFQEVERRRGPLTALRADIPPASTRVKPAAVVRRGECTIVVGEHDLWIARGDDRVHVPPEAELYEQGSRLTLVVIGPKQAEIRVY